jgi:SAM-dependent methyltransferase
MLRSGSMFPRRLVRLARLPFLGVRWLRWKRGSWSKESDRTYHEHLYEVQDYDPFRLDYPGYVTIRRFADHVEPLLPSTGTVLDVGCGPGEITCELARRHPGLSFVGVDHSEQAIVRAKRNAERLSLSNVRFAVGDAEQLSPGQTYGLVTMFDAFHHLERPHDFLAWLRTRTTRCVLIEPAGTWSGGWARTLDLDWLLFDLANIRERLEVACGEQGEQGQQTVAGDGAAQSCGEGERDLALDRGEGAVERRYALEDFETFFKGWSLRVTGTIAGFDRYPPDPHARSGLRPVAGDLAYALVRATDDLLRQRDRDGAAKHWVIAATTEAGVIEPRLPSTTSASASAFSDEHPEHRVKSRFDVRYERYEGPTRVKAGAEFRVTVDILNAGWDIWRGDGDHPVHVSYHWLREDGEMAQFDGVRSHLPRPVGPGESCRTFVAVTAPSESASYVLAVDLVMEGVTWFSEAGMPWHAVRIDVR